MIPTTITVQVKTHHRVQQNNLVNKSSTNDLMSSGGNLPEEVCTGARSKERARQREEPVERVEKRVRCE
jgi:hypothetical protein